jgi:hypothetical protein
MEGFDNLQSPARFLRQSAGPRMKPLPPKLRRTIWLLAWVSSVLLAYYSGGKGGTDAGAESRKRELSAQIADLASRAERARSRLARGANGKPEDAAARSLQNATGEESRGPLPDFKARLADIQSMPPGVARNEAYFKLINEWATADGQAALAAAGAVTEPKLRYELRESALRSWAGANPEAAWKFASENPNGDLPENRMDLIFEGFGRGDAAKTLAFFAANAKEMEKYGGRASYVFDELYERGNHDQLVAWAEKMPAGQMHDMATNRIIDRWARYDPEAAKAWMDRMVTNKNNLVPARIELAESWARVNPAAALQWVNELPKGQQDGEYFSRIFGRWIQYDRNAAARYLASQPPSPQLDKPIERYTNEVMRQNPADTMPWAESISDGKRRWEAITRVAEVWRKKDPAGLETYVTANHFSDEQRKALLNKGNK